MAIRNFRQPLFLRSRDKIWVEGSGNISFLEFLSKICITAKEFDKYLTPNDLLEVEGYAIVLDNLIAIAPVKVPFHPPQGWRYFEGHPEEVIKGWKTCSSTLETILAPSATYKRLEQNETINS